MTNEEALVHWRKKVGHKATVSVSTIFEGGLLPVLVYRLSFGGALVGQGYSWENAFEDGKVKIRRLQMHVVDSELEGY